MSKNENKMAKFLSKVTDFGKKASQDIQKSAKNISEKAKQDSLERQKNKLKPIFPKDYKRKDFKLPNVIKIIDDATDKNKEVCKGAIGRLENVNNVEVFYLYDEWIKESGLVFVPVAKCNDVFCVDPFDRSRFIKSSSIFTKTNEEKLAELEHIAFSLGAKRCSIELVESIESTSKSNVNLKAKVKGSNSALETKLHISNQDSLSGKSESVFEGSNEIKRPVLKWFANDNNILYLIDMRCSGNNSIKQKSMQLKGSSSATMSYQTACAIDKLLNVSGNMEKQAIKESNTTLIFEVEF
ncbi:MAG: hypothetical protein IKC34_01000 [Clostridia bacterium]|nr:hypothetical protein [Clostridia bacterium]